MENIKGYYLMPHPPIMIPEVGKGEERKVQKTIDACNKVGKEVASLAPEVIIIISPHGLMFSDAISIMKSDNIQGSLAPFHASNVKMNLQIDKELTERIINESTEASIPVVGLTENVVHHYRRSLELDHGAIIPLYFINKFYQNYKLVHITYGYLSDLELYQFGTIVFNEIEKQNRSAVVIASGDLSHRLTQDGPYPYSPQGKIFDETFLNHLQKGEIKELFLMDKSISEQAGECGMRSVYILLGTINGSFQGELLSYQGPFGVGYGVMKFIPTQKDSDFYPLLKDAITKDRLNKINNSNPYVKLARKTIETFLKERKVIPIPNDLPQELLSKKAGVFVSLKKHGALRGCIGTFLPTTPCIASEIIQNAIDASTQDPRFSAVEKEELLDIDISVDILSKPELATIENLDPKVYGVIVKQGSKRGLLLPDLEGVDSIDEQLEIACKKAGINPQSKYEIERFLVTRYHEGDFNGKS